ncbi:MAG: hypothetical protein Rubg2KO_15630 [Rubricoccaceae bacterium]
MSTLPKWLVSVVVVLAIGVAAWFYLAAATERARQVGIHVGRADGEAAAEARFREWRVQEQADRKREEAQQQQIQEARERTIEELVVLVDNLARQDREVVVTRQRLDESEGQPADVRLPLCFDALSSCERARVVSDSVLSGERRKSSWLEAEVLVSGRVNGSLRRELALADSQVAALGRRGDELERALALSSNVLPLPSPPKLLVSADVGLAWLPTLGTGIESGRAVGGVELSLSRYVVRAGGLVGIDGEGDVTALPVLSLSRVFR